MPRVIAVKVPDDIYEELVRRARKKGYTLVSDYIMSIIARELGYSGEESVDVERIVERKLQELIRKGEIKVAPVNLEEAADRLAARLERKVQDMINPWTAKIDSLQARLAELTEKIEELEQKIKELEEARQRSEAASQGPQGFQRHAAHERGERGRRRRSAIERLREQGVVFEREVQWLRDRDAFFERLRREGAIVLELGGERVAVDPEFWRLFREKLAELPTANDEEVRILLTQPQYELFKRLKELGLIYFDTSKKAWRFVEEPQTPSHSP